MSKIVSVMKTSVKIGKDDGRLVEVPLEKLTFMPRIGDEVDMFVGTNDDIVVTLCDKKATANHESVHINLQNTNANTHSSQNEINNVTTNNVATGKVVNKVVYGLLAIFLGGIGVHKFYAGKIGVGIIYFIFSLTLIPAIIGLIEGIIALTKPADANGNIIV